MSLPFCNNLRTGDPVIHAETKRPGKVEAQPRETSTNVQVLFQGSNTPVYVHLSKLRLVVDGKPEEHPPCDGEIPVKIVTDPSLPGGPARPAKFADAVLDPRDVLRARRDALKQQMEEMTKTFTAMREECDRIDAALKVLG